MGEQLLASLLRLARDYNPGSWSTTLGYGARGRYGVPIRWYFSRLHIVFWRATAE
jgi:hypothetical protein